MFRDKRVFLIILFQFLFGLVFGQTQKEIERLKRENDKNKNEITQLIKEIKNLKGISFLSSIILIPIALYIVTYEMKKRQKKKIQSIQRKFQMDDLSIKPLKVDTPKAFNKWVVLGASVIGKSHIQMNLPCQDYHFHHPLSSKWGIAVVCDGAGSALNSHIGSTFIAKEAAPRCFKALVEKEKWIEKHQLPSQLEWEYLAKKEIENCYGALKIFSESTNLDFSSLACTVIVLIYSPLGILISHIGDGRAGYKSDDGTWIAAMTPHKGEEANQTIFLTSNGWFGDKILKLSGVTVPESRVINEPVDAFVLMSDGCENHSFECSHFDKIEQKWSDPNKPFEKFFNPLVDQVHSMATSPNTDLQMNEKWKHFLSIGTEGLKNEPDDKTMVIGITI